LISNKIKVVLLGLVVAAAWGACGDVARRDAPVVGTADHSVTLFVIRRSWHTDIGFDVADLQPPLASLHAALPKAHYLLFGFGDKHYLMSHAGAINRLTGAVWSGEGLVMLTGLEATPEAAFGAEDVVRLTVSATQAQALEDFVWRTLATQNGAAKLVATVPYDGSQYYASAVRYSGLHTCNQWTAEGLRAAGLPVHEFGVEFSWQIWRQVTRIRAEQVSRR